MSSVKRYSTFWPRFLAVILDRTCLSMLSQLLASVIKVSPGNLIGVFGYVSLLSIHIYAIFLHGLYGYGQTVGKLLLSLKVVNYPDEKDINFKQAILRDIVPVFLITTAILIYIVPINQNSNLKQLVLLWVNILYNMWYLLEIIIMFSNKKRRALHDFIAQTIVIKLPSIS